MKEMSALIILLILSSCEITHEIGIPRFHSYEEAFAWVGGDENIIFKYDILDEWQLPEETLSLKTGDCEDKAILILDIIAKQFGEKGDLVFGYSLERKSLHYWAEFENNSFWKGRYYHEISSYSYEQALTIAHFK